MIRILLGVDQIQSFILKNLLQMLPGLVLDVRSYFIVHLQASLLDAHLSTNSKTWTTR